ncbi:MAG TPA: hypothetical protein VMJ10_03720 [Kofleriaceae bacterium]|nr:hypothetical protein [Kofleriaceae bacterium]
MRPAPWLLVAAAACRDTPPPPPPQPVAPPPARDAARGPADAAIDASAACAGAPTSHRFRFGTLAAPPGWCWQRTAEGDDQSGVVLDDTGRIRARYFELSFGEQVGDACDAHRAGVHAVRDGRAAGVAYRTCELDGGRRCFSFHGEANLCTEPPEDAAFSAETWVGTLVPPKRG